MADLFDEIDYTSGSDTAKPVSAQGDLFDEVGQDFDERSAINRGEGLRSELAKRMEDAKIFSSFTTAATQARDKSIRRNSDGTWDLPRITPAHTGGNIGAQTVGGVANLLTGAANTLVTPITGARLEGRGNESADQVRSVFDSFQKDNNLSDDEMQKVWGDMVNRYRKWDKGESLRMQSDGSIELNPLDTGVLNTDEITRKIQGSTASNAAKSALIQNLPEIQQKIAENKAQAYAAASVAAGRGDFNDYSKKYGPETKLADVVKNYERDVLSKEGALRKAAIVAQNDLFLQGFGNIAQQGLGVAGLLGSDAAAKAAAEMAEGSQLISQGSVDAGLAGEILKQVPSIAAQVLLTRGVGAGATAAGATAQTAQKIATGAAYLTAGLQSAGGTFASEYQKNLTEGMTDAEALSDARVKAAKAGVNTTIITSLFGAGKFGGVESAAVKKPIAEMTLKDLAQLAGREGIGKAIKRPEFRTLLKDVAESSLGEGSEEFLDELGQTFLNQDPDTNLNDALDNAVKAFKIGAVAGGASDVAVSAATNADALDLASQNAEGLPAASEALRNAVLESNQGETSPETQIPQETTEVTPVEEVTTDISADISPPQTEQPNAETEIPEADRAPSLTEVEPVIESPTAETPLGTPQRPSDSEAEQISPEGQVATPVVEQTPTTQTNERQVERQQGQGRQEVLTPAEGDLESEVAPAPPTGDVFDELAEEGAAPEVSSGTEDAVPTPESPVAGTTVTPTPNLDESSSKLGEDFTPTSEAETDLTSIKNAATDKELERLGLPPIAAAARKAQQKTWDEAQAVVEADPQAGSRLTAEVQRKPRQLSDVEEGVLLNELAQRKIAQGQAQEAYFRAVESGNETATAAAREVLSKAQQDVVDTIKAARKAGTEWGRAGRFRQVAIDNDFSLAALQARYRIAVNDGKPLTPDQEAKIAAISEELQSARARLAMFEEANAELQAGNEEKAAKIQEQAAQLEALTSDVEQGQKAAARKANSIRRKIKDRIKPSADAARARLAAKGFSVAQNAAQAEGETTTLGAFIAPDPRDIRDMALILADNLVNASFTIADAAKSLVDTFGEAISPYVEQIFGKAKEIYHETSESVQGRNAPTSDEILDSISSEEPLDRKTVWDLARAKVISGLRGRDVLNAVTEDLSQIYPDVTHDQVAELFTDYGKVTYPSANDVPKELNRIRSIERTALKLQDVLNKQLPKRTGFQRGETDAETRELDKKFREEFRKLEEEMRAAGVEISSDERRLKSSLEATKRRMQNEIEEIERSLASGEARTRPQGQPVTMDEEGTALRARLEKLRADYDEAFGKREITPEQRVAATIKLLDRQITEEQQMLADGILKRPANTPVTSPEIETRRAKLKELRQTRRDLYEAANPGQTQLEQAKAATRRSIEKLSEVIASGDTSVRKRQKVTPDAELQALLQVREDLSDEVDLMRQVLPTTEADEQAEVRRALEASQKTLSKLNERLVNGSLDSKPKTQTAASQDAGVRAVRDRIKELNRELGRQRRESKAMPPEEAKLKRYLAASQKRRRELSRRIHEKDFTPKEKSQPLKDPAAVQARHQENKLKRQYNEMLFDDKLKNRTTFEKIRDNTIDAALHLPRALKASLDVSGIGRQGALVAFAHPSLAAREFPKHFAWSDAKSKELQSKMEEDPDYDLAKDSGLALTDIGDGHNLNDVEENYKSRIARKIPGVRHSERGYTTFLNALRMSYFKHLVDGLRMKPDGMTEANLKLVAQHVNNFTGRGNLGRWDKSAGALADILFSPRFIASRIGTLWGGLYSAADAASGFRLGREETKAARKLLAYENARTAVVAASFMSLIGFGLSMARAAAGEDDDKEKQKISIGTDPLNSDFGKLKVGEQRYDFGAGLLQFLTFGARFLTGKRKNTDGLITYLSGPNKDRNSDHLSLTLDFLRNKLSPVASSATNLLEQKDSMGKPVFWEDEAVASFIPLPVEDMYENYRKLGFTGGTASTVANFFGIGSSVYGPKTDKAYNSTASRDLLKGLVYPFVEGVTGGAIDIDEKKFDRK